MYKVPLEFLYSALGTTPNLCLRDSSLSSLAEAADGTLEARSLPPIGEAVPLSGGEV